MYPTKINRLAGCEETYQAEKADDEDSVLQLGKDADWTRRMSTLTWNSRDSEFTRNHLTMALSFHL